MPGRPMTEEQKLKKRERYTSNSLKLVEEVTPQILFLDTKPFVIYTIFLRSVIFPYNSLYTQSVAYTTYFQLGEPVVISTDELFQMDAYL